MGREHCFERGHKLKRILQCVNWEEGRFLVEWEAPGMRRELWIGEAYEDELKTHAKEELFSYMKGELRGRVE